MGEGIGTGLDEDEDPDAWQRDTDSCPWAATMMQLDASTRCGICQEILEAPVSLPCAHIFCSLCIRRSLSSLREECPQCRQKLESKDLLPSRTVGTFVEAFKRMRQQLLEEARRGKKGAAEVGVLKGDGDNYDTKRKRKGNMVTVDDKMSDEKQRKEDSTEVVVLSDDNNAIDDDSDFVPDSDDEEISASRKFAKQSRYDRQLPRQNGKVQQQQNPQKIPPKNHAFCPICGGLIRIIDQDSHVEQCLRKKENLELLKKRYATGNDDDDGGHNENKILKNDSIHKISGIVKFGITKKPDKLPKLCYQMLTEKQLKKTCARYELPTNGKRDEIVARLQEYTIRFNAMLDNDGENGTFKTPKEVVEEVLRHERNKKKENSVNLKFNFGNSTAEGDCNWEALLENARRSKKKDVSKNDLSQVTERNVSFDAGESVEIRPDKEDEIPQSVETCVKVIGTAHRLSDVEKEALFQQSIEGIPLENLDACNVHYDVDF